MHLNTIDRGIQVGTLVKEGEQIGTLGSSANGVADGTTSHLHYEISVNGKNINPTTSATTLVDLQIFVPPIVELNEVVVEGIPKNKDWTEMSEDEKNPATH